MSWNPTFAGVVDVDSSATAGHADGRRSVGRVATEAALADRPTTASTPAISVIVPSYRGVARLERCLASLASQTLSKDRYEVLLVLNGPDDGSRRAADGFARGQPSLDLRILRNTVASASAARNLGLNHARFEYITFVDDDDYVSRGYLEALLAGAAPDRISLARIQDVNEDGSHGPPSYLEDVTNKYAGQTINAMDVPTAFSLNACKALPASACRRVRYDESLRSGEDVLFMAELLAEQPMKVRVCGVDEDATYHRVRRAGSVSRQSATFDFYVAQRIEVIDRLHQLLPDAEGDVAGFIRGRARAQARFINEYLLEHPDEHGRAVALIEERAIDDFPYRTVNDGLARTLVISYCFSPYADTSGTVMAKRIRNRGEVVDVISNSMDEVRQRDDSLSTISAPFMDKHLIVQASAKFASWPSFDAFRSHGFRALRRREDELGATYQRVYSRAMWPASNFLAAQYKIAQPKTPWIAEFSDPISRDIHGSERHTPFPANPFLDLVRRSLAGRGLPVPDSNNAFFWCEYLAMALADLLLFTNENQRDYMLSYQPPAVGELARAKSAISPHPVPDYSLYHRAHSEHHLDETKVNIAYFGSFYATRGLGDVLDALEGLGEARETVRLHIFTNQIDHASNGIKARRLDDVVVVAQYVPYLEFLDLARRFDCLLVNDTDTSMTHEANPYLASKWSDYRGSGSVVWGLVEPNSVLSREPLDLRSHLGDVAGAEEVLHMLARARRREPLGEQAPGVLL